MQGNIEQCSRQHLQRAHEKAPLGCISGVLRDFGSRGDIRQKPEQDMPQYLTVSKNSRNSRQRKTRRLSVARALGYEFGELSVVKTEGRFIRVTWDSSILCLPRFVVPMKEKSPCSLLFNSHK